jgi:hypothetical protein
MISKPQVDLKPDYAARMTIQRRMYSLNYTYNRIKNTIVQLKA